MKYSNELLSLININAALAVLMRTEEGRALLAAGQLTDALALMTSAIAANKFEEQESAKRPAVARC
jgi:hypothetical protein